jgi:hypothetical protein
MDVLSRIKRLVLRGRILYTRKARDEMADDGLTDSDVVESLLNAQAIAKPAIDESAPLQGSRETVCDKEPQP